MKDEWNVEVGCRLKKVREALSLTQKDFARKLDITDGAISVIEIGKARLTQHMAKCIAYEYGVNPDWLATGEGEMFRQPLSPAFNELTNICGKLSPITVRALRELAESLLELEEDFEARAPRGAGGKEDDKG